MLFGIHPWQMLFLDNTKRIWYEMAAMRHMNREHEIRQEFLNALVKSFGGGEGEA